MDDGPAKGAELDEIVIEAAWLIIEHESLRGLPADVTRKKLSDGLWDAVMQIVI